MLTGDLPAPAEAQRRLAATMPPPQPPQWTSKVAPYRHEIIGHRDRGIEVSAAMLSEMRWILDGCERANSLVMNSHKWLFVPVDSSALYTRHPDVLRRASSLVPAYLETSHDDDAVNYMNYGPQLGCRVRALKLWMAVGRTMNRIGMSL